MIHFLKRAIVVGGGIGGLSAAIALDQMGVEVTVYEQAGEVGEVGAGLILWPNAIKALRKLGLGKEVVKSGAKIFRGEICTPAGKILSGWDSGDLEFRFGAPVIAIHRADLHKILLSALPPGAIRMGMVCTGFQQDDEGVTAHFANGQSERADLLIGADGIHSPLRRQLFPEVALRYSGYIAWRGVVAAADENLRGISREYWGRGKRFGIVPLGNRRIYWYATANLPSGQTSSAAQRKETLLRHFSRWHSPLKSVAVKTVIAATPAEAILYNDIYDFPPLSQWRRGRVVLLGDAAHATTPNMGQGACMAVESSLTLARCLADGKDLRSSLRQYESERMPRTAWITRRSHRLGRLGQLENPLACLLRNLLVWLTPDQVMKKSIEKAVGYEV